MFRKLGCKDTDHHSSQPFSDANSTSACQVLCWCVSIQDTGHPNPDIPSSSTRSTQPTTHSNPLPMHMLHPLFPRTHTQTPLVRHKIGLILFSPSPSLKPLYTNKHAQLSCCRYCIYVDSTHQLATFQICVCGSQPGSTAGCQEKVRRA